MHSDRNVNEFHFLICTELGSDEESGKDWSDLEREAAEDDANYSTKQEDSYSSKHKKSRNNDRRDKHKSSKNHR